jgi:hypothetical protein
MKKAREDLSTAADLIAVASAVAGVAFWISQAGHWRTAVLVTGSVGWLYLVAVVWVLSRPAWIGPSGAAIERAQIRGGLAFFGLVFAMAITVPLSLALDTTTPLIAFGLLLCCAALVTAARALGLRYR